MGDVHDILKFEWSC